jgi:hypothetical protein
MLPDSSGGHPCLPLLAPQAEASGTHQPKMPNLRAFADTVINKENWARAFLPARLPR